MKRVQGRRLQFCMCTHEKWTKEYGPFLRPFTPSNKVGGYRCCGCAEKETIEPSVFKFVEACHQVEKEWFT